MLSDESALLSGRAAAQSAAPSSNAAAWESLSRRRRRYYRRSFSPRRSGKLGVESAEYAPSAPRRLGGNQTLRCQVTQNVAAKTLVLERARPPRGRVSNQVPACPRGTHPDTHTHTHSREFSHARGRDPDRCRGCHESREGIKRRKKKEQADSL